MKLKGKEKLHPNQEYRKITPMMEHKQKKKAKKQNAITTSIYTEHYSA